MGCAGNPCFRLHTEFSVFITTDENGAIVKEWLEGTTFHNQLFEI